ncbi:MAG: DUF1003 domain-containing protein [Dehalococcoidia bacterium]
MKAETGASSASTPEGNGGTQTSPPRPGRAEIESAGELAALHERTESDTDASERLAHRITAFSGSMVYVWLHVVWFGAWIAGNAVWFHFDPFPFTFLTMIVSLEAIFLSTFVLISQNRQAYQADHRASVDLELNMVAEREITKMMDMIARLQQHLGMPAEKENDTDLREMLEPTAIANLAEGAETAMDGEQQSTE